MFDLYHSQIMCPDRQPSAPSCGAGIMKTFSAVMAHNLEDESLKSQTGNS